MASKVRKPQTQKVGNFALAVAMVEKRRSGAAGPHADKRTRRARTRGAARARALGEW